MNKQKCFSGLTHQILFQLHHFPQFQYVNFISDNMRSSEDLSLLQMMFKTGQSWNQTAWSKAAGVTKNYAAPLTGIPSFIKPDQTLNLSELWGINLLRTRRVLSSLKIGSRLWCFFLLWLFQSWFFIFTGLPASFPSPLGQVLGQKPAELISYSIASRTFS